MANTQPVQYSFGLTDELGVHAPATIYAVADPNDTLAALVAEWAAFAALLDAVTGAQITRGKISLAQTPGGGLKGAPVALSRIEQTGVFNFSLAANPHHFGEVVPALPSTKIVNGRINLADAAVAAYTAALTAGWAGNAPAGGPSTGGTFSSEQGVAIAALVDAFVSFRKRRRQLRALSFEL